MIADLLKQKEAAIKDFDEKLAELGYQANSPAKPKRSHHKPAAKSPAGVEVGSKGKAKA